MSGTLKSVTLKFPNEPVEVDEPLRSPLIVTLPKMSNLKLSDSIPIGEFPPITEVSTLPNEPVDVFDEEMLPLAVI